MKTIVAALLAVLVAVSGRADTNAVVVPAAVSTNATFTLPSWMTCGYVESCGIYNPGLKHPLGMGTGAFLPIGQYLVLGGRVEYFDGKVWASDVTCTLKLPIQIGKTMVTPFVIGGYGLPLSEWQLGRSSPNSSTIVGAGCTVGLYEFRNIKINLGASVEDWSGFKKLFIRVGPVVKIGW